MAVCNQLDAHFNHQRIDEKYDFYLIATIEKYIPFGAKCLDFSEGKIESLAFENGKLLYIMLKKVLIRILMLCLKLRKKI